MKTLFLVIIFLTLPALVSAETVSFDDLVKRNYLFYKKFSDSPFTGKVNGRIQGIIKRGKRQGLWLEYHENGQLKAKANFKDGKLHGLDEWYYKNGQLEQKKNYKDGELHGLAELYRENGQLKAKGNWKDGKLHGLFEWYYENGQLKKKGNFEDEELISVTCFSETGEEKVCDD